MKKINLTQQILLVVIALQFSLASCHNYYKAIIAAPGNNVDKAAKIQRLQLEKRYFVLRNGSEAFHLINPVLNADKTAFECTLDTLSILDKLHLTKGRKGKMQYKKFKPEDIAVLNEVHLYVTPDATAAEGKYLLALDKLQKIEVIEKDKKRTTGSYVMGGLGITAGALIITSIIFVAAGGLDFGLGSFSFSP